MARCFVECTLLAVCACALLQGATASVGDNSQKLEKSLNTVDDRQTTDKPQEWLRTKISLTPPDPASDRTRPQHTGTGGSFPGESGTSAVGAARRAVKAIQELMPRQHSSRTAAPLSLAPRDSKLRSLISLLDRDRGGFTDFAEMLRTEGATPAPGLPADAPPPSAGQLDMAPAKGKRIDSLRSKNRLCWRHVLVPEGPKYDSRGQPYLGEHKGRDYAATRRPALLLPRCCNCCRKSLLGCD